jgi:hypothetical protein
VTPVIGRTSRRIENEIAIADCRRRVLAVSKPIDGKFLEGAQIDLSPGRAWPNRYRRIPLVGDFNLNRSFDERQIDSLFGPAPARYPETPDKLCRLLTARLQ